MTGTSRGAWWVQPEFVHSPMFPSLPYSTLSTLKAHTVATIREQLEPVTLRYGCSPSRCYGMSQNGALGMCYTE